MRPNWKYGTPRIWQWGGMPKCLPGCREPGRSRLDPEGSSALILALGPIRLMARPHFASGAFWLGSLSHQAHLAKINFGPGSWGPRTFWPWPISELIHSGLGPVGPGPRWGPAQALVLARACCPLVDKVMSSTFLCCIRSYFFPAVSFCV